MTNVVGISFSEQDCRMILCKDVETHITYHNAHAIKHTFDDLTALPTLLSTLKPALPKKARIIAGIPSSHIIMRDFILDANLSDKDILHFLTARSVQIFGHDSKNLSIDYEAHPLEENKQKVTVVAAHQTLIDEIQHAFKQVQLNLAAIDVDICAIHRANNHIKSKIFLDNEQMSDYAAAVGLCLWRQHEH